MSWILNHLFQTWRKERFNTFFVKTFSFVLNLCFERKQKSNLSWCLMRHGFEMDFALCQPDVVPPQLGLWSHKNINDISKSQLCIYKTQDTPPSGEMPSDQATEIQISTLMGWLVANNTTLELKKKIRIYSTINVFIWRHGQTRTRAWHKIINPN